MLKNKCLMLFIFVCVILSSCHSLYDNVSLEEMELNPVDVPNSLVPLRSLDIRGDIYCACMSQIYDFNFSEMEINKIEVDYPFSSSRIGVINGQLFFSGGADESGNSDIFKLVDNHFINLTNDYYIDTAMSVNNIRNLISYSTDRYEEDDYQLPYHVVILDVDNKSEEIIFSSGKKISSRWSPDGNLLAIFEYEDDQNVNLYFYNDDDKSLNPELEDSQIYYGGFAWSPDQSKFAISGIEHEDNVIYFVDVDSQLIDRVTVVENYTSTYNWSPTGHDLLYEMKIGKGLEGIIELYILDVDNNSTQLIYSGNGTYLGNYSAVWSPDGDLFAYFLDGSDEKTTKKIVIRAPESVVDDYTYEFQCVSVFNVIWEENKIYQ